MNNLFVQAVLVTLVAFIGYMHSYVGSTMHNRPIIMGTLVGLVLGDLTTGIIVGGTLELVFLGAVPIGASNPPDMVSGAVIGTAFTIVSKAEIGMAVTLAVPIASLVLLFDNFQMSVLLPAMSHIADKYAEAGDPNGVDRVTRIASIGNKVLLSLIVGISFYVGVPMIETLLEIIPEWVTRGFDVAAGIIPALGFALLAKMIVSKELVAYLLLGFLITAYLGVPTFGVALAGLVVALIVLNTNKKEEVIEDDNEF